ncbi:reverse transcriptase [Colletotrichum tofieldiae]|uniref:Reverse transcriptase n=1 Tax=Colletotrichum tofieldiae TaxID=708197 RepID=A0A161Y7M3_9PEZI|nr:reverse transcriptase [Colletotrichum tofieldiae]
MKLTTLNYRKNAYCLKESDGSLKRVDKALLGKHTRQSQDRNGKIEILLTLNSRCALTYRSNLSFYLGGKSPSDDDKWTPNMQAVRAAIRFALATGRLDARR